MKRMLFNATHAEETRVGIVDGSQLIDIDIETVGQEARKSNIYMGIITRIEPSLEACFVDYGEGRHGFLPFKEISRSYYAPGCDRNSSIREALSEGQEVLVQIIKDERGTKGAGLTTYISLAGRYLVLMPNNPRGGGVSRRIEGQERDELREAMRRLDVPQGMSTIARTAGIGRTTEELQWDLNYLLKLWEAITDAAKPQYESTTEDKKRVNPPPYLIVEESNLVVRAIRDYFQPDIEEILVDTPEIYEQARQFMSHVMPDMVNRVKLYQEDIPLFTRFQIEQQIETAYSRTVPLPSGGAIVIDHTEALVAIDVNSARSTRGSDIEETALRTNLEAADEVARQMRLRDLGGLIVIDFIDMDDVTNQKAVENRIKSAIRFDRARVQTARISRFGLMEVSRQRLRPSLSEGSHVTCPRCNGVGVIRDTESCAIQVLRILQEEAIKDDTGAVEAQVPVDVATFLLNEKRNDIASLELRHQVPIILVPNTSLETPHYHIERILEGDERLEKMMPSFKLAEEIETVVDDPYAQKSKEDAPVRPRQVPVIKNVLPSEPAPIHTDATQKEHQEETKPVEKAKSKGFFSRLISAIFGNKENKEERTQAEDKVEQEATNLEDKPEEKKRRRLDRNERNKRRRSKTERLERTEDDKPVTRRERKAKSEVDKLEKSDIEKKTRRTRKEEKPITTQEEKVVEDFYSTPLEKKNALIPAPRKDLVVVEATSENSEEKKRRRRRKQKAEKTEENNFDESSSSTVLEPVLDAQEEPHGEEMKPGTVTFIEDIVIEEVSDTNPDEEIKSETTEDKTNEDTTRRRPRRRRKSKAEKAETAKLESSELIQVETKQTENKVEEIQEVETRALETEGNAPTQLEVKPEIIEEPLIQVETKPIVSQDEELLPQEPAEVKSTLDAIRDIEILEETSRDARERFSGSKRKTTDIYRRDKRRNKKRDEKSKAQEVLATQETQVSETTSQLASKVENAEVENTQIQIETKVKEEESLVTKQETETEVSEIKVEEPNTETEVKVNEPLVEDKAKEVEVNEASEDLTSSIAYNLSENLARANLVQVETKEGLAHFTGYTVITYPGRKVEPQAALEKEELIQVETNVNLCEPYSYHAPKFSGRPYESTQSEETGPLIQVETKKTLD